MNDISIGIVVSKFNSFITEKLLSSCIETLVKNNIEKNKIDILSVPGAYEIPFCVKHLLNKKKYNIIITLGAVIKGETPHFDYICNSVSLEIMRLSTENNTPIIFGIITANTIEQAQDRAGGKIGNKGTESAIAALELISELRRHQKSQKVPE